MPVLGKFCDAFSSIFTKHSGIFYLDSDCNAEGKAYEGEDLVDVDPLLLIKDTFVELLDEGNGERVEKWLSRT